MAPQAPPYAGDVALERLVLVRRLPAFRALSEALGGRIEEGRSPEVFRFLRSTGAPEDLAFTVVDGWPLLEEERRFGSALMTIEEEAAVRLSFFYLDFRAVDWNHLRIRLRSGGTSNR